jgi:DNA-binding NarL/FixJ family response regulator
MPESLTPFLLGALFAAGLALALWSILGRPPHPRPREKSLTAHIVPARAEPRSPWTQLTPKQQEVAALLEQGLTNKEIAAALTISVNTVQSHCSAIYGVLGVKNRGQLTRLMRERRWEYASHELDRI